MSTQVFPTLTGEEWDIKRSQIQGGVTVQESISGKRTSIQNWSSPRWAWEVSFSYLDATPTVADLQTLMGFFNSRGGRYDTFLYTDKDDYTVTTQALGTGDGTTAAFQLVRTWGGFVEPIFAPNTVSKVYVNGVDAGGANWSVTSWGATSPGVVTFNGGHIPTAGQAVTADFTFYWPCRFDDDSLMYNNFMKYLYENKTVKFSSEK